MEGITKPERYMAVKYIADALSDPGVKAVRIGKTTDIEREKQQGKYDEIIPLTYYIKQEDADEFIELLEENIKKFENSEKFKGVIPDTTGESSENTKQRVYLAIEKVK